MTDPTVILWDRPELSLTTPLGIALWSVVRAAWAQRCLHKFNTRLPPPPLHGTSYWQYGERYWKDGKEHPTPTLPREEVRLLTHALISLRDTAILQHPRVAVSSTRSPPKLFVPARKRKKKFLLPRSWQPNMRPSSKRTNNKGGRSYTRTGQPKTPKGGVGGGIWRVVR